MSNFVEKLDRWFAKHGDAAMLYVEVQRLRELRPAMQALLREFRQLDLPYGSAAYSRGVSALNEATRDIEQAPLPNLDGPVAELRVILGDSAALARESHNLLYAARRQLSVAMALNHLYPRRAPWVSVPQYQLNLSAFALADASEITDVRLAVRLGHTRAHSQTVLLQTKVDNQAYTLILAGYIEGFDPQVGPYDTATISACQLEQLELPWEKRSEWGQNLDAEHGPWFEWVDVDGNPVGDVFDRIPLDPALEIEHLKKMLQPPLAPVSFDEPSMVPVP